MKKQYATLTRTLPVRLTTKGWEYETDSFEVEIMTIVGRYAMVRRKGCIPFVCDVKELTSPRAGKYKEELK